MINNYLKVILEISVHCLTFQIFLRLSFKFNIIIVKLLFLIKLQYTYLKSIMLNSNLIKILFILFHAELDKKT